LPLERVDNVERRDGLALGVLSVGDGVTDDTLEEGLEDAAGLLVDHWDDALVTRLCVCVGRVGDGRMGWTYWQRYA